MMRKNRFIPRLLLLICGAFLLGLSIKSLRDFSPACRFDSNRTGLRELESRQQSTFGTVADITKDGATGDEESTGGEKLAYVTFLSSETWEWWRFLNPFADHHDKYFISVRMLAYQILHAPHTRTKQGIPFLVMVTKEVAQKKRQQLARDGALVFEVEDIVLEENAELGSKRWKDDMTKLRIAELTAYDRVLFLDCDMILTRSLDGIFDEPAAQMRSLDSSISLPQNEEHPPKEYVFAALGHATRDHDSPPTEAFGGLNPDYFNSGFILLHPDPAMLKYYFSQMGKDDRFSWRFPQQNFLNFVHEREGAMPWQMLPSSWNVVFPSLEDYEAGVATLHDKWWNPYDKRLKPHFAAVKLNMETYHMGDGCINDTL